MWNPTAALVALFAVAQVWSFAPPQNASDAFYQRNIFYAGGEYQFSTASNGTILVNQLYVEQLTPRGGKKHQYPIVFVHGGAVSGTVRDLSCSFSDLYYRS